MSRDKIGETGEDAVADAIRRQEKRSRKVRRIKRSPYESWKAIELGNSVLYAFIAMIIGILIVLQYPGAILAIILGIVGFTIYKINKPKTIVIPWRKKIAREMGYEEWHDDRSRGRERFQEKE